MLESLAQPRVEDTTVQVKVSDDARTQVVYEPEEPRRAIPFPRLKKKLKRDRHKRTKVSVFRYAYYDPAFKFFVEQVLDCDYLQLPKATKRTMDLGIQNSSDYVCTPFKHMMGDWIEALELGADILVQVGGPCRLGYYGEMQEQILRDMGYEFTMLNFSHGIEQGYFGWGKEVLKMVNPDIDIPYGVKQLLATGHMLSLLDQARDFYMANGGFECERGAFRHAWEDFLDAMRAATDKAEIDSAYARSMEEMRAIPLNKPANPVRIGIIGELYTAIDENSNLGLDEKLMDMGVEVYRTLNFSNRYTHYNEANLRRTISEYAQYDMGPTSTMTLAAAKKYAQLGFDGLIHAKCAGCTPEIDCIPVLRRISEDFHIPVLYLTYDTETSDTGLMTRLEAFYDMLYMKNVSDAGGVTVRSSGSLRR
ncbi:hypothetical protein [Adlercreutzia sp. ZJ304]|nr:hypothetical protein [Adlercreutzia sp. ZJ304]